MATNYLDKIFQCSECENKLEMDSKTLTCLHSLCARCLDEEFQGEIYGNGQCPKCQEDVKIDQLTLSPFLTTSLKRRRLESTEWKCDACWKKAKNTLAKIWCKDCHQLICDECELYQKYREDIEHDPIQLDEKGKDEVRKATRTDFCNAHKKVEECYCNQCNACLCETCYKTHLNQSPQCPPHPISVSEEAVKKRTSQGPILLKQIELKNNLQERNRKSHIYCEELEMDCQLKCKDIWQNYQDNLEKLKEKITDMCEDLSSLKDEQVKKWQELMKENERMLKKLEIWCLNLHHLLGKDENDKNEMICGVEFVGSKLASSSAYIDQLINEPIRKCKFRVKFSEFWQQFIEGFENEIIACGSSNYSANLIEFEAEWYLPELNTKRWIQSIVVSQKDCHIFLADFEHKSIIELTEFGEIISEFILIDKGKKFHPREMFLTSSEMLVVNCREEWKLVEKLFFLKRKKCSPFLEIKQTIEKVKQNFFYSFSICHLKENILICDTDKFLIDFYTENGEYIKTIGTGESGDDYCPPRIRADPSTGNFWGAIKNTSKLFCFDENGQKLKSFETKEKIWNFSINEFGNFYFCDKKGIFSFFPERKLHAFRKESEKCPRIFVSNENVFVCLKNDEKFLIKIFKILE